jgi:hypothetical protein
MSIVRIGCSLIVIAACASKTPDSPRLPPAPWRVPATWRHETFKFPLEFAPQLAHTGIEELRFAPGFGKPETPGYWSYAFVWRTGDPAMLDAGTLGSELTAYFRGLIDAVDQKKQVTDRDAIVAKATAAGDGRIELAVHVIDVFNTFQPVALAGWAERRGCGQGSLWVFVLAPTASPVRGELDTLAREAACGQPTPPDA